MKECTFLQTECVMLSEADTIFLVLLKSWESDPSLGETQAAGSGVAASCGK